MGRSEGLQVSCRIRLTAPRLLLDDCDAWTLNALLTRLSSYRRCTKRLIFGHSAVATSVLPIADTMKCSHIARGFSFGNGTGSAAEPSPQCFDKANRKANLIANGCEEWRRKKLPVPPVSLRNSRRVNKTSCCTSKTDTSLKLILCFATVQAANREGARWRVFKLEYARNAISKSDSQCPPHESLARVLGWATMNCMILFGIVFMPRDRIDGASHRVVREKEHGTELLNELGRPAFAFSTLDGCGRDDSSGRSQLGFFSGGVRSAR